MLVEVERLGRVLMENYDSDFMFRWVGFDNHTLLSQSCLADISKSYAFGIGDEYCQNDSNMTRFRPCIDLHAGQVKQIVGGSLSTNEADLKTNYVSKLPSRHYAGLYKSYKLYGAHIIMLGPGNEDAAKEALHEWPGHLQIGGGITDVNAMKWISEGAEKVACKLFHLFRFEIP